jgi:nucleotidyltransferase/DNA polymerase involved in DNA repair
VQRNPRLADVPLIVGDAEQPKRVFDCSLSASERRVRQGMTVREALGACPDAVIVPPDPVLYRNLWEVILNGLWQITPEVEDEDWGRAYLNVGGLEAHYRDEEQLCRAILQAVRASSGLDAGIGVAGGKFPARAAASTASPGRSRVVPRHEEEAFLAPLSVGLLPFEGKEVVGRMRMLGLEQIGDLAPLSVPELQSQFGFAGKRISDLVHGIDNEGLRPRTFVAPLLSTISLEAPVAGIDVMIALAGQLLSRLKPALNGRAARELVLQAELTSGRGWEHRLVFREPVSEDGRLRFLLRSALTNFPPPQAIRSLSLRLSSLSGETGKQLLLGEKQRQQRQVEEAIRQLKARYGYSPIYRCVDVEPWSVIPEERQILVESDA